MRLLGSARAARERFGSMASEASIKVVISSEQRFVSCPSCRSTIALSGVQPLEGAKLLCAHCGARIVLVVGNKSKET